MICNSRQQYINMTLPTSQAAQVAMQCFIIGIVFPLEGRVSEIQRRDSEIPKILEVSISFVTASFFSTKTKCATVLSNYWKRDTRIGYVNPKCYLLRRGNIRIADQPDKAKPCTIDRQFAVKQCLEEVASTLSVRIIKSILAQCSHEYENMAGITDIGNRLGM